MADHIPDVLACKFLLDRCGESIGKALLGGKAALDPRDFLVRVEDRGGRLSVRPAQHPERFAGLIDSVAIRVRITKDMLVHRTLHDEHEPAASG